MNTQIFHNINVDGSVYCGYIFGNKKKIVCTKTELTKAKQKGLI